MITDEVLILAFQKGSREAFEELFYRYRQPLYGFFRRRLSNPVRAEDLTQESFLAVLRSSGRYEQRSLFRTYLYGIALKLLSVERRKAGRSYDSIGEPTYEGATDASLWVRQALARIDPDEREILMLREYEQLSYAEIASLLRLPLNTVRSKLFRARLTLKEHLEPVSANRGGVA